MKITTTLLSTVSLYVLLGATASSHLSATMKDDELKTTTTTTVAAKDAEVQLNNVVDEEEITTNPPVAGEKEQDNDTDDEEEEEEERKQLTWWQRMWGVKPTDSFYDSDSDDEDEDEGEKEIPNAAKKVTPQIPTVDPALQAELQEKVKASDQAVTDATKALMEEAVTAGTEGLKALLASVDLSNNQMDLTQSIKIFVDEKQTEETPRSDDESAAQQAAVKASVVSEADVERVLARANGWGWGSTIAYWTILSPATVPYEVAKVAFGYVWGGSSHKDSGTRVGGADSLTPPSNDIVPMGMIQGAGLAEGKYLTPNPEETTVDVPHLLEEALPPVIQGVVDNVFAEEPSSEQVVETPNDQTVAPPQKESKNQKRRRLIAEKAKEAAAKELKAKVAKEQELEEQVKKIQEDNAKKEQEIKHLREMLQAITQNSQQKD